MWKKSFGNFVFPNLQEFYINTLVLEILQHKIQSCDLNYNSTCVMKFHNYNYIGSGTGQAVTLRNLALSWGFYNSWNYMNFCLPHCYGKCKLLIPATHAVVASPYSTWKEGRQKQTYNFTWLLCFHQLVAAAYTFHLGKLIHFMAYSTTIIHAYLEYDSAAPSAIALAGTRQAISAHGEWTWHSPLQRHTKSNWCIVKPQFTRHRMKVLANSHRPATLGMFALHAWHYMLGTT